MLPSVVPEQLWHQKEANESAFLHRKVQTVLFTHHCRVSDYLHQWGSFPKVRIYKHNQNAAGEVWCPESKAWIKKVWNRTLKSQLTLLSFSVICCEQTAEFLHIYQSHTNPCPCCFCFVTCGPCFAQWSSLFTAPYFVYFYSSPIFRRGCKSNHIPRGDS